MRFSENAIGHAGDKWIYRKERFPSSICPLKVKASRNRNNLRRWDLLQGHSSAHLFSHIYRNTKALSQRKTSMVVMPGGAVSTKQMTFMAHKRSKPISSARLFMAISWKACGT
jgi:hypothetical protein